MRYVIAFLVGLLAFCSNAQPLTVAQADSLRLFLRTNKADTNRVGSLLRLSGYFQGRTLNYRHNLDTALVLATQAQRLSQQLRYDKGQLDALFQQGRVFIKQEKPGQVKRMLVGVSAVTRIRLLLELGKSKLRPTYSQDAKLDSAMLLFSQAEGLSNRIGSQSWQQESQMLTGVAYLLKGDCKSSKIWFMRVIAARQRAGNKSGELRAWLRWAATQYSEWKFCEYPDSLNRAFALTRQLGERPREALLMLMVSFQHFSENKREQAKQAGLKALAIQKAIGYPAFNHAYHALVAENDYQQHLYLANILNAYGLLGDVAQITTNPVKGLFYHLEVVKDLERSGLWEDLEWPYFWLGNIYYDLNQFDKAFAYYQQSLSVSHRKGQVAVYIGLPRRMAVILTQKGEARQGLQLLKDFTDQHVPSDHTAKMATAIGFGQCYAALGQNKQAEQYYLEAVAWGGKFGVKPFSAWLSICEFYVATAQYDKAAFYVKKVTNSDTQGLSSARSLELYKMQFKIDSAQANHSAALHHFQRYSALKDSLLNQTTNQQMAELDVRYQTRQKEQTLLLRQKDIRLLTQQSHNQQTQRNALIGGTVLLVALLGISFNRYRLKQRSNQLLEVKQELINDKNEALQRVLTEKEQLLIEQKRLLTEQERLLKEIHHRVKNNLQVVMSLLNSQATYLSDEAALSVIHESQHRVQAMALIHQKLYQTEGIARIPMADYIADLVAYLQDSYDLPQPIAFELQVEFISLDITQAVPLGLIINEAITNALKYAFPAGRTGTVQVGLREMDGVGCELMIADDGVGLPTDFDPALSRSLGMTLIRGFSEQLGGQLHVSSQSGIAIRLLFPDEKHTVDS